MATFPLRSRPPESYRIQPDPSVLRVVTAPKRFPLLRMFSNIPGSYLSGTVDIQQINGVGVSPTFGFAIGVDFK